ncbi:MAG: chromosomal replication initiator protein DnaA [Oscillospiraceae bacterium]|nr:chromosomal replication initiator protein DnaA [Oscillospiraceae bacterium]
MNNAADIWKSVYRVMKEELQISSTTLETWFDDMRGAKFENNILTLVTGAEFKKDVVLRIHTDTVKKALFILFSKEIGFEILTEPEFEGYIAPETPNFSNYDEYSFEKFVVGASNKFAHAAAKAVASAPGTSYNPLLIHGGSGLGKTHLLYAIAGTIKKNNPKAKITYIKSEDFTNELIAAIQSGTRNEFREKYRNSDILLVDDIQFIAGKDSTQEEFFHTFNALHEAHRQIVLTSDRPPKEMAKLEERLKTRFEWGLLADIEPPDFETRMAIISLKADLINLKLTTEQKELIANNVTANVRQLEGAVHKLLAYRDLLADVDGMQAAERAIRDIFAENPWINPTPEFIIKAVAKYFELEYEDIIGKDRSAKMVEPRKIAMYMVRNMTNESYPKMGKIFNRDHTTIKYSVDTLEELLKTDNELKEQIKDVKNSVLTP